MGIEVKYVCDLCGATISNTLSDMPAGWAGVVVEYRGLLRFLLCADCRHSLFEFLPISKAVLLPDDHD